MRATRIAGRLGSILSSLVLLALPPTAGAVTITVNGALGDLDGNGDAGTGEAAVVGAAAGCWNVRVATNRNFTLTVTPSALTGTTTGQGSVTAVDGNNIPTAGTILIDNDGSTNWQVDATPLGSLEFTPDPNSQWRFTGGPAGSDLLRTVLHEIGHATGWLCGATCSFTNPRYEAMYNPIPANFVSAATCAQPFPIAGQPPLAGCVFLQENTAPHPLNTSLRGDGLGGSGSSVVNELSHPGVSGDLMIGFGGSGTRETPSFIDVDMFSHAYGDAINLPPTVNAGADIVDECSETGGSTLTLDASGSTDPESNALTYLWTCPAVSLSDAGAAAPSAFFPKGPAVTCRVDVTDLAACNPDADAVAVTVVDTTDPVVTAPADITAECTSSAGTPVAIGLATAVDVCDDSLAVNDDAPALYPLGDTTVTWTSQDDDGNLGSDTQTVTVEDTTPPELEVTLSQTALWPPNHKLVEITAEIVLTDVCDAAPTLQLVSITSNEPDDGLGDGHTSDDTQAASFGTDDRAFELRSERSGNGAGRIYTITYQAMDGSGNTTIRQAVVAVAHNP